MADIKVRAMIVFVPDTSASTVEVAKIRAAIFAQFACGMNTPRFTVEPKRVEGGWSLRLEPA
jgi:hypothetical protein